MESEFTVDELAYNPDLAAFAQLTLDKWTQSPGNETPLTNYLQKRASYLFVERGCCKEQLVQSSETYRQHLLNLQQNKGLKYVSSFYVAHVVYTNGDTDKIKFKRARDFLLFSQYAGTNKTMPRNHYQRITKRVAKVLSYNLEFSFLAPTQPASIGMVFTL